MSIQQATTAGGMPILILKEGSKESKGRDAQKNNFTAAKTISELVRTSLGPRGMDKMLVDTLGDVTITNDGATILKEIDVQHPAAKMMVEISKATDNEVGDGTTSVVILAAALIEKAEELIDKNVHPTIIVDGYSKSAAKALQVLNAIAQKASGNMKRELIRVAKTSMQTKLVSKEVDLLADIVVSAAMQVAEKKKKGSGDGGGDDDHSVVVDIDNVKLEKKAGGSIHDTSLIEGVVLDKEVVHGGMPKKVEAARIALINSALEIEKTEFEAKINISSPEQMQKFLDEENNMLKSMVDKIVQSGANFVVCQKGIDDIAQHYLAKSGIMAVRRAKESDLTRLSKATGGRIVNNLDDLSADDLGFAKRVEERKIETDKWVFVEGCRNPKAVTILIRGGSQRVVDEAERSVHDALSVSKDVLERPATLAGGGAPEAYAASEVRKWASSLSGREQLAAEKFAEALEVIPLTLAENAGMNVIDTLAELRAKQSKRDSSSIGIDARNAKVADMAKLDVIEPLVVKEQIIKSATEAASMILRIDDVIASSKSGGGPAGGPPVGGMGGMGM